MRLTLAIELEVEGNEDEQDQVRRFNAQIEEQRINHTIAADIDMSLFNDVMLALEQLYAVCRRARARKAKRKR